MSVTHIQCFFNFMHCNIPPILVQPMCICSWLSRPAYCNQPDVLNQLVPQNPVPSTQNPEPRTHYPVPSTPLPTTCINKSNQCSRHNHNQYQCQCYSTTSTPVPRCAGSTPTSVSPVKGVGGQMGKGPPKNMRTLAPTIHHTPTLCAHNAHPLVLHIITFQDPSDSPRDR